MIKFSSNTISKIIFFIKCNKIIIIFMFLAIVMIIIGAIYNVSLSPNSESVNYVISKFSMNEFSLPYYVAERYVIWLNMRTFFTVLDYSLTLLSIVASLMTVFYASTNDSENDNSHKEKIVFLSLLATCLTIGNIFINAKQQASMAQHAWRELDICIIQIVNDDELSVTEKNRIIVDKVIEMEKYIELNEIL